MRVIVVVLLMSGCSNEPCNSCRLNLFANIADFDVSPTVETPMGVKIDAGEFPVDLESIDRRIRAISKCIMDEAQPAKPEWQCLYDMPVSNVECLTIKVVKPTLSKCSNWQFIGVPAPNELCEAKGEHPTDECPCLWRTGLMNDWVVITPPQLYMWDVGRALTSCNGIWNSPYAKCLMF